MTQQEAIKRTLCLRCPFMFQRRMTGLEERRPPQLLRLAQCFAINVVLHDQSGANLMTPSRCSDANGLAIAQILPGPDLYVILLTNCLSGNAAPDLIVMHDNAELL